MDNNLSLHTIEVANYTTLKLKKKKTFENQKTKVQKKNIQNKKREEPLIRSIKKKLEKKKE